MKKCFDIQSEALIWRNDPKSCLNPQARLLTGFTYDFARTMNTKAAGRQLTYNVWPQGIAPPNDLRKAFSLTVLLSLEKSRIT